MGSNENESEDGVGQQRTGRHTGLNPARVQPPPAPVSVLDDHQHGPAPFSPHAEALDKSQNDQEHRRGHADLIVRRQNADQECRQPHQHQRGDQHGLSAHAIAEVPEHDAADRPSEKADRVGSKRCHRADERIERGKEELD